MPEWIDTLKELSDDPENFEFEGGLASLSRHGTDYLLELKTIPGAGVCVMRVNDNPQEHPTPIDLFVQQHFLELPRLARQIQRTLDAARKLRPAVFVDGPARLNQGKEEINWPHAWQGMNTFLAEAEPGSTRLVQLMAAAGQGKTVLLEELAAIAAQGYRPESFPRPLVLVVDLLGRYVGNIDDAIAGSLNNTYLFPSLTQKDVMFCIRRQWLQLALDGFDELVARIGARDAFLRISDLVDQLGGSGSIILSARESFFELYQITASIRTYLQPKVGTYATAVVTLMPWSEPQGREVFTGLRSKDPLKDLTDLISAFDNDTKLVLQPFFLTRLAELWVKGERFPGARGQPSELARTRFIIESFVGRETFKWQDRDGNLILTQQQHFDLLSGLAEEMWRSGAFRLTVDELRVATEFYLGTAEVPAPRVTLALSRIPTHGTLAAKEQRYSFIHDRFFSYFLAIRVARCLIGHDSGTLNAILEGKELPPSVIQWAVWSVRSANVDIVKIITFLQNLRGEKTDTNLSSNLANLCTGLVADYDPKTEVVLSRLPFVGDLFSNHLFTDVSFVDCDFWHVDFKGTKFEKCRFQRCKFGDVLIDEGTSFVKTEFDSATTILSVELSGRGRFYAPTEIEGHLKKVGGIFPVRTAAVRTAAICRVNSDVALTVGRFVRASERTTDVAVEDMEEQYGDVAPAIAKAGIRTKTMKKVDKQTKGPKKTFVRFGVDRDALLQAQAIPSSDPAIEAFWVELAKRYPPHRPQ